MTASELAVGDYGSIPNGLFHFEDPDPATCSFDISWSGPVADRSPVSGPSGSSRQPRMCEATMERAGDTASGRRLAADPKAGTLRRSAHTGTGENGSSG